MLILEKQPNEETFMLKIVLAVSFILAMPLSAFSQENSCRDTAKVNEIQRNISHLRIQMIVSAQTVANWQELEGEAAVTSSVSAGLGLWGTVILPISIFATAPAAVATFTVATVPLIYLSVSTVAWKLRGATSTEYQRAHQAIREAMSDVDFNYSGIVNGLTFGQLALNRIQTEFKLASADYLLYSLEMEKNKSLAESFFMGCQGH